MKPAHLGIEAVVCAAPSVAVGLVGALIFFGSGLSMLAYNPVEAAQGILISLGIVLALVQYAALAARTIFGEQYRFGLFFWLAAFFGLLGAWYAFNFFGFALGAAIVVPVYGATFHFTWLQARRQRQQEPNAA